MLHYALAKTCCSDNYDVGSWLHISILLFCIGNATSLIGTQHACMLQELSCAERCNGVEDDDESVLAPPLTAWRDIPQKARSAQRSILASATTPSAALPAHDAYNREAAGFMPQNEEMDEVHC